MLPELPAIPTTTCPLVDVYGADFGPQDKYDHYRAARQEHQIRKMTTRLQERVGQAMWQTYTHVVGDAKADGQLEWYKNGEPV